MCSRHSVAVDYTSPIPYAAALHSAIKNYSSAQVLRAKQLTVEIGDLNPVKITYGEAAHTFSDQCLADLTAEEV
jgi:hypothetical protein